MVSYFFDERSTESVTAAAERAHGAVTTHLIAVYVGATFVGGLVGATLGALVVILDGWLSTAFTGI